MPIPLLQLQKETLVSCRQAKRLVTELFSPTFVAMQWLCSQSCSKWGCQLSSCPCVQNVTHCNRRFVGHVSFQESLPAIPFGKLNHPLPARSRFLRVRSTCFAWLPPAHPFVAATGNNTCFMQTSKAFGHAVVVSKIWYKLQYCDCALSCAMRLLQTNEHLSRLSF